MPSLLVLGHGRRHLDAAAAGADALLGVAWVLFVWSVLGQVAGLLLLAGGVGDPARSRWVAGGVLVVTLVLVAWGYAEAMRVPRVREVDVAIARLGRGLDGLRVALITDTHYGPIDRSRWSAAVAARVNTLDADVVGHVGDIADGTVDIRETQASPLASVRATSARVYVTGNHEYFNEAQGWLDYMDSIGWTPLHNRHVVVERGGDRLIVAGVDDATAQRSGVHGHGANLDAALAGADRTLPVLLLAHQPKQVAHAVHAGVDLQVSGHTHGGQIWPFHLLVRLEQPAVQGLSRHGGRTQLYTSRGTGFWGPPFRVFAPSEITLLTLRTARSRPQAAD
jgi:predicted MPP superfamily phosphohydrolase